MLATVGAGCFERRGVTREQLLDGLEPSAAVSALPTVPELLALRVPKPPPVPPALAAQLASPRAAPDRGDAEVARLAAALGNIDAADVAWQRAGRDGQDAPGAALDRCLVDSVLRRYATMVEACTTFLRAAPADPRALGAALVLQRAASAWRAAGNVVAAEGPAWVKACARAGGSCADLAFVVMEQGVDAARAPVARVRFDDAVLATGRLRRARVEGPFDGDVHVLLRDDLAGRALTPATPNHGTRSVIYHDGLYAPAAGGQPGLYRITFEGRGQGAATLYLLGADAARVRLDGIIVAERDHDARAPATIRAGVSLEDGDHRVEVLAWVAGGARVGVALLSEDGEPLLRERTGAGAAAPTWRPAGAAQRALDGAVERIATAHGQQSEDVDVLLALSWESVLVRPTALIHPDRGQELATTLVARFGWSPLALASAAELIGYDDTLPERVALSLARPLWAHVRARLPEHPVAQVSIARALRDERPDEALDAYRALVTTQPRYPFGHRELIPLALEHGLVDEARASAAALLELDESPENIDAAVPALRAVGEARRAEALVHKQGLLAHAGGNTRRARRAFEAGKTSEGIVMLEETLANEDNPAALEEAVGLLALRDAKLARTLLDGALERWPAHAGLLVRSAELLRARDGDDVARAFLVERLPLLRGSERAFDLALALGVAAPWHPRLALGDAVIARRRALAAEPWPGHGVVALLDDVERSFFEDGSSWLIRHLMVELRSKEALDAFGEISPGSARVVRLRVVKPDGTVVEPERHRGVEDVSLPDLALGDIVELLTARQDDPPAVGGFFETRALDHASTPAFTRAYALSFPEGWDVQRRLEVIARGVGAERACEVDAEGRRRVRIRLALVDVAPVTPEPSPAPISEAAATAGVAWGVDDAFWARLRGHAIERAAERSAWLDAAARHIAGEGSDTTRLQRLFAFVVQRIEPAAGDDRANTVLATGQGPRTALLLALARAVGLDAAPVALQLPSQADPATLDGSSWSVLAVRVRVAGRTHMAVVDGNAVLDALPPVARGARVLDLSRDARGFVDTIPDGAIDGEGVRVQADLQVDAVRRVMDGVIVLTLPAAKADGARRGVRRATPEQLRQLLEGAFADTLPGIRVLDVNTPDVDNSGAPLRLGARVEVPLPAGAAVRFEHLFAQGVSAGLQLVPPVAGYLHVADRRQALVVTADRERLEIRVVLPPSASFVEVPEALDVAAGPFRLRQRAEVTDGVLVWTRELSSETLRVPVRSWPALRVGLASLTARMDARLAFVLGPGPEDP